MKTILAAAVALGLGTSAASAGEAVPNFDWDGLYFGVNGGGAFGTIDWTYVGGPSANWDSSGGVAGGTLGYNVQNGQAVLGLEGDFDWADIDGAIPCPNPAYSCQSQLDWFATVRARAGWAMGRVLVFGTVGVAAADMTVQTVLPGGSPPPSGKPVNGSSTTAVGWTAGLGAEYDLGNQWSGKVEWLVYDLGTDTYTVDFGDKVRASQNGNLIRVGINRRFN
jgi:outer membrane immunogenic protein